MLSDEEKREMIEDAKDDRRREHFRAARKVKYESESLDDYILFLNSLQKIFSPFVITHRPTQTRLNKL